MKFEEIKALDEKYVLQTYARYPLALAKGKGCKVWDTEGNEYLDMIAGVATNALGHAHPKLMKAISEQAGKLMHVSNLFYIENQAKLAKMLCEVSGVKTRAFFCNSGAEANEAAIKISRKYTGRREIIAMSNSFHGRTMGSLAITDKKKYQAPFEPLMPETRIVPYGDFDILERAVNDNTAAIFVEMIQGEGGVKFPKKNLGETIGYMKDMRKLCDEKGIMMVVDEVQTGTGRTGKFFAYQHCGIKPDIITTAKGIAGGFPVGVTLVSDKVGSCMHAGDHGSTFGGSPLACAAGIAVVETIIKDKLMENAAKRGKELLGGLEGARGLGLMVGIDVGSKEKAQAVKKDMQNRGILINVTNEKVIRLVPPLIISKKETDFVIENLKESFSSAK